MGQPLNGYIIGALQEKRDRLRISLVPSAITQRDAERHEEYARAGEDERRKGQLSVEKFRYKEGILCYTVINVINGKHNKILIN